MACAICSATEAIVDHTGTLLCARCIRVLDSGTTADVLALYDELVADLIAAHPEPEALYRAVFRIHATIVRRMLIAGR